MYNIFKFLIFNNLQTGDDVNFPPLLKNLEKREYIVTLEIQEENIKKLSSVYTCVEMNEPSEMQGNHTPPEESEPYTDENVNVIEGLESNVSNFFLNLIGIRWILIIIFMMQYSSK